MREYQCHLACITEFTLKNIRTAVTVAVPPKYFYPISEYSNLMCVPQNVKPDWLALAIETCDLVLGTDPTYKGCDGHISNRKNIKLARQQKKKLLTLRAKVVR